MRGRDKMFEAECRDALRARKQKTIDKLEATLTKLEETIVDDVSRLEPKERASMYVKLLKFVLPTAQAETAKPSDGEGAEDANKRFAVFSNVLNAAGGMVN